MASSGSGGGGSGGSVVVVVVVVVVGLAALKGRWFLSTFMFNSLRYLKHPCANHNTVHVRGPTISRESMPKP